MARNGQINIAKEILFPWIGLLYRTVDPSELLQYLMEQSFFDSSPKADEVKNKLLTNDQTPRELLDDILDYMYQQQGNRILESFLQALKNAGYEYQEDWIRNRSDIAAEPGTEITDEHQAFRDLLDLFAKVLCDRIIPNEVLGKFYEKGLLRDSHVDCIEKSKTRNQKVLGILHYMTVSGKKDWPVQFCEVLMETGESLPRYQELAELIQPKICKLSPDETVNEFTKANTYEAPEREIEVFTYGDSAVPNEGVSLPDETDGNNFGIQDEDDNNDQTNLKRQNIYMDGEAVNKPIVKMLDNNIPSGASVFSAEDNAAYPDVTELLGAVPATVTAAHYESKIVNEQGLDNVNMNGPQESEELSLRPYQMELAQEPLKGLNTIIVAPTGTGKTLVAVYIAKVHLEQAAMDENCVVFLAPYGHLVDQQESKFRKYLPGHKIVTLHGGDSAEGQVPLGSLLEHNDILVMTPQCLLNALNTEGHELLHQITMLFIDECHETKKEHACKKVMSVYLDAKLSQEAIPLPQVVGLTASVGVGDAKTKKAAENHLLKLAANLDAQKISIVTENEADLRHHANEPKEGYELVEGRKNDPFKQCITEIMEKIEVKIKLIPESEYEEDSPRLRKHLMKPTAARNTQQYMNWVSPLEDLGQRVQDSKLRRVFITAKERLEVLHKGLELNDDCESQNALEYIKQQWEEPRFNAMRKLPEEKYMHELFLEKLPDLEDICLLESQINPKLSKLLDILENEYFKSGRECRIIIFVRTRELTECLVKWVETQPTIGLLRPKAIVGSAELTSPEQEQIVNKFRRGDYQLLITTSVTEQGMDIPKCNMVIRYEYVTNDIGRVQARGRARAGNARHILVTERKIGQDYINFLKEGLMGEALQAIGAMSSHTFNEKVNTLQKLDWQERKRVKTAEKSRAKLMRLNAKEYFILRCSKCDEYACNQEDLRLAEDAHRMVINKEFKNLYKYTEVQTNKKKFDGIEKKGKIHCRKCARDWGVLFLYKQCDMPVLKLTGFAVIVKNEQGILHRISKPSSNWKDMPIAIKEITAEDLENFLSYESDEDADAEN